MKLDIFVVVDLGQHHSDSSAGLDA